MKTLTIVLLSLLTTQFYAFSPGDNSPDERVIYSFYSSDSSKYTCLNLQEINNTSSITTCSDSHQLMVSRRAEGSADVYEGAEALIFSSNILKGKSLYTKQLNAYIQSHYKTNDYRILGLEMMVHADKYYWKVYFAYDGDLVETLGFYADQDKLYMLNCPIQCGGSQTLCGEEWTDDAKGVLACSCEYCELEMEVLTL